MELLDIQPQLIVRNENLVDDLKVDSKYIIYKGLGHVVLNVKELKDDNLELLDKILTENEDNYYFRISFMEDIEKNKDIVHCYLNEHLQYFKPKKLTKSNKYCFLGIDFIVVTIERLSQSKNFNEVGQYKCTITQFSIDKKTGDIVEEEIWKKTKYGNIESFLPKNLVKFKPIIGSVRRRLYFKNSNKK